MDLSFIHYVRSKTTYLCKLFMYHGTTITKISCVKPVQDPVIKLRMTDNCLPSHLRCEVDTADRCLRHTCNWIGSSEIIITTLKSCDRILFLNKRFDSILKIGIFVKLLFQLSMNLKNRQNRNTTGDTIPTKSNPLQNWFNKVLVVGRGHIFMSKYQKQPGTGLCQAQGKLSLPGFHRNFAFFDILGQKQHLV